MIFAVGRHMQVLLESPESVAWRERHPRARQRLELMCSCDQRRRENGHCVHTLAIFENNLRPGRRRDVTVVEMRAKGERPARVPVPMVELEREVLDLRARLKAARELLQPFRECGSSFLEFVPVAPSDVEFGRLRDWLWPAVAAVWGRRGEVWGV